MLRTILIGSWAAVLVFPVALQAGNYGMAGCGLGSIVMGADGGQILAATTNASFGSQILGITSGTSNCTDEAAIALNQEVFLRNNFANIALDAAVGQGQYLAALGTLFGCDKQAKAGLFRLAQAQHTEIFESEWSPAETLQRMKQVVGRDRAVSAACARL